MLDVNQAEFGREVLEASKDRLIVVDFWSTHCRPCEVLSPVLAALEAEGAGRWLLVKVDVDENPQLATDYRVMSLPGVKAFLDGVVVEAFVGTWPRDWIAEWLAKLLPDETNRALRAARRAEVVGEFELADAQYRSVLDVDPSHPEAHLGLAALAVARRDSGAARAHLGSVPEERWPDFHGRAEAIWLHLAADGLDPAPGATPRARYERGLALAAAGRLDDGLEELLAAVAADANWEDGLAGKAMVRLFTLFDTGDPRAGAWRARLGRLLYRQG